MKDCDGNNNTKPLSFIRIVSEAMRQYSEYNRVLPDTLLLHNKNGRGSQFFYNLLNDMKSESGIAEISFHDFRTHNKLTLLNLDVVYSDIIISEKDFAVYQRKDEKFYQLQIGKVEIYPIFRKPIPPNMLSK